MRFFNWLWLAVLATACIHEPGMQEPAVPMGIDERLDIAEAADFCDRWNALQGRDTPEAALLRAELGLQVPRAVVEQASCTNYAQLQLQGARDAIRATQGLPNNSSAWMVLGAWLQRAPAAPQAVAEAVCKGAELSTRDPLAWQVCGDWLRQANDAPGAIAAWKKAFELSPGRAEQCGLLERIRKTGSAPEQALESLPTAVIQDCDRRRQALEERREERGWHEEGRNP